MARLTRPAWQSVLLQAWRQRGLLSMLLWPMSLLTWLVVRLKQGLYMSGIRPAVRLPVPVIVVGNVVAGGSGKTPVVMALVRHLQSKGWSPGVISRGYGRQTRDCQEVFAHSLASEVGDEPALIHRLTQVPVVVARARVQAAQTLLQRHPQVDILLSDDGLQHLALARDVEICVFDDRGVGNGFLLPAGPLREPWPRWVDLVLHTGARPAFTGYTSQRTLASHALRADGSQVELSALRAKGHKPLMALAAIAQPDAFFDGLRQLGLTLTQTLALPDHFDFQHGSLPESSSMEILCTEKDATKLWHLYPQALAVPLIFTPEPAFLSALDHQLAALVRAPVSSAHGNTSA